MNTKSQTIFLPPLFRFLMELTAWTYFVILAFTDGIYILGTAISVILLTTFNFPGDKHRDGPINAPGWVRILNEWISGGLFSIIGAFLLFQEIGAGLQFILVIVVIFLDRERYAWLLGYRKIPPDYVTMGRTFLKE